jgi:hypothetical protein
MGEDQKDEQDLETDGWDSEKKSMETKSLT